MTRYHSKNVIRSSVKEPTQHLPFESPGTYRIRVRGHIDDSLADQLGGMVITGHLLQIKIQ